MLWVLQFQILSPNDITHAQGASYLGVVLEKIGVLEWNGTKKRIQWRIIKMPDTIDPKLCVSGVVF